MHACAAALALVLLGCGGGGGEEGDAPATAPPAEASSGSDAPVGDAEATTEPVAAAELAPAAEPVEPAPPAEPVDDERRAAVQMEDAQGGSGDLDDLLDACLAGANCQQTQTENDREAASSLPESPGRDEVAAAFDGRREQVRACYQGPATVVTARVVFAGATGRAREVRIGGTLEGTPAASCMARVIRGVTLPRFSRPAFPVTFPYRVGDP